MTKGTARLHYDSARIASAVGLRSSLGADRTLIFRTSGHTIDVMIQTSRKPPAYLHGQVVREATGSPVSGACVALANQGASATTDRHGEFLVRTEAPLGEHLLRFGLQPDSAFSCRIPPAPPPGGDG